MKLRIVERKEGYSVFLDEKEIRDIMNYELKKTAPSMPNKAVLTLTMLVECTIG